MTIEQIARICHEANRAYCISLGDLSQSPWEECQQWQRDSAVAGVRAHLANPDMTPEQSHQAWMDFKLAEGWKHGPVKDPAKKEHPQMVPYAELPVEQRAKDYIFSGIVEACAPLLD